MAIPRKVTAYTVRNATRAGVGRRPELQMTDEDRAEQAKREEERVARLARIAARARG
jgi:hypothetical protein